jgi:hypothetical protein
MEIESVLHKQTNGFDKIGHFMVEGAFAFMVHLKMLHCSPRALRLKMHEMKISTYAHNNNVFLAMRSAFKKN